MSFRTLFLCQAPCVVALSMISCADSGTAGDLGNGSFAYRCVSDRDPMCSLDSNFANSYLKELPGKVAVGASFEVAFKAESSAAADGSAVIVPVSEQLLGSESSDAGAVVFRAKKAGFAGLLASRGSTVVEVLHFALADVDHVRIEASGSVITSTSSVEIGVGSLLELSAAAADASDQALAGSLDDAWTSDDPAIAQIMTSPATDTITVRGGAPGETSVHASIGGRDGAVLVKVVGPGAGGGGAGGSGETGGAGGSGGEGGAS